MPFKRFALKVVRPAEVVLGDEDVGCSMCIDVFEVRERHHDAGFLVQFTHGCLFWGFSGLCVAAGEIPVLAIVTSTDSEATHLLIEDQDGGALLGAGYSTCARTGARSGVRYSAVTTSSGASTAATAGHPGTLSLTGKERDFDAFNAAEALCVKLPDEVAILGHPESMRFDLGV